MPDALKIWSEPAWPRVRQIPLNLARDNDKTYFENVLASGGSMKLFSEAMECLKGGSAQDPSFVIGGFDWAALGEGPIVDLGSGNGHISIALARGISAALRHCGRSAFERCTGKSDNSCTAAELGKLPGTRLLPTSALD